MRMLTVSIVIGPLVLIGALPAAGQSTLALGSGAPVLLAAGADSAADRDTYTQMARDEMQEWQRKLQDFSEKAAAKGKRLDNATKNDLNKAWTKAKAASNRLQTAGARGWERAKTSFEEASRELANAWDKIRPEDK
jgi:Skp family chaperone for outer membrane proteins